MIQLHVNIFFIKFFSCIDFDKDFIIINLLANGEFGKVYKCKSKSTDLVCAIKKSQIVEG